MIDEDVNGAIMGYLDYVIIKTKRNPDYDPHPILKAMMIATHDAKKDGNYMGVSGNGNTEKGIEPTESYAIVVEKKSGSFIIQNITDLMTNNELTIYDALLIIELSLKLEKIQGELVPETQIKQILNDVLRDVKFEIVSPTNFVSARDYFKEMLKEGKVKIPYDEELKKGLLELKHDTKWEDYNPKVRSLIGMTWAASKKSFGVSIDSTEMPKKKVMQMFKTFFTGEIKEMVLKNLKEDNQ